ncbi:MAG TPA: DUF4232 domain-containing protein [Acidimicrobiales bacterium]|jgi:hypothetical protein|nr:DUF4232 domain-containing protein [Acidimicrobiales bacterium]
MSKLRVAAGLLAVAALAAACSSSGGHHGSGTKTPQGTQTTASTTTSTLPTSVLTTTTTAAPSTACALVSGVAGQTQGAAGTIVGTVTLSPVGVSTCTLVGYPTLIRYSSTGAVVPVHVVDGLTVNLSGPATQPAAQVTLTASQPAEFTFQYSDVQTGSETTCAASSTLAVVTPGQTKGSAPFALAMSPCSGGTVEVSPFYAATAGG